MNKEMIAVARIASPFGVRGEVKLQPLTDFPHRFESTKCLFLVDGTKLVLESARVQKEMVFAKFKGIDTPEAWLPFRRQELFVPEDELVVLPEGQYYIFQLIGLAAFDEVGVLLGSLAEVLQTGSNDVYVIKTGDGQELLIPAIDQFVKLIDMDQRRIVIVVPEYW